jgi:hypothetical protein
MASNRHSSLWHRMGLCPPSCHHVPMVVPSREWPMAPDRMRVDFVHSWVPVKESRVIPSSAAREAALSARRTREEGLLCLGGLHRSQTHSILRRRHPANMGVHRCMGEVIKSDLNHVRRRPSTPQKSEGRGLKRERKERKLTLRGRFIISTLLHFSGLFMNAHRYQRLS